MTFQGDDKILRDLVNVARSKKEIRLLNIFKGIPITYEATILGMDERGLTFSVFKYQSVCLELDKLTFIECDSLPYTIKARVVALDIVAGTAILGDFLYAAETIGRRSVLRVHSKDPIEAVIKTKSWIIRGVMADISVRGIGVNTQDTMMFSPGAFREGAAVQSSFRLPAQRSVLKLSGTILNIIRGKETYRLGIEYFPDTDMKNSISQYISFRQAEILREVKTVYNLFYNLKLKELRET